MSKLIELVEEYGRIKYDEAWAEHAEDFIYADQYKAEAAAILSELRTRLEALERDAARYQWLRREKTTYRIAIVEGLGAIDDCGGGVACTYQNDLTDEYADRVIDAAIAEGSK